MPSWTPWRPSGCRPPSEPAMACQEVLDATLEVPRDIGIAPPDEVPELFDGDERRARDAGAGVDRIVIADVAVIPAADDQRGSADLLERQLPEFLLELQVIHHAGKAG